jgi:HK97 family phage major capsid protein
MADQDEAKKALEELSKNFKEFREVNDKRLEALKAERATSDFDEKLDRINESMAKQERVQRDFLRTQEAAAAKHEAAEAEFKARQQESERKLEARVNRLVLGIPGANDGESTSDERLKRRAYVNYLRKDTKGLSGEEMKVLVEAGDPTGGYLAPPTFVTEIIKAVVLFSPMRPLVTVRQSSSAELQLPKRTQTAAATRVGEASTRTESQNPGWGLLKITSPEMYAEARVSQANLEDSAFNLEQLLTDEFSEQFGVKEGAEVISGTGVNQCLGFLDANAAGPGVPIAYTPSTQAATIASAAAGNAGQGDGLIDLFHTVKTAYAARGTWCLNRNSLGKVRSLKDTQGHYLWQPGIATSSPPTILGAPYVECPDMPNEGANTFPIAFGDWKRAYTLVDRIEMAIVRDPYTVASSGQVKFFARRRVGGQVVLGEAIRLYKCAST